jgi:hypothetical protein
MKMPDWLLRSVCVGLVVWLSITGDAEARMEFRPCDCFELSQAWVEQEFDSCSQMSPAPPPGQKWCSSVSHCMVNTTTGTLSYWGSCDVLPENECPDPQPCGLD